jgi:hypothetical protein
MIDDDIGKALRVDPSPEFLVRVRARVAEEPQPSAWRWSWPLAGAAALAAAIVIAAVVSRPEPKTTSAPQVVPAVVQAFSPATPDVAQAFRPAKPASEGAPAAGPTTAGLKLSTPPVMPGPATAAAPEILIDTRERQVLLRLIAAARDGRVELLAAQTGTMAAATELAPVADIVIPPIAIDPLAPLSGAEGVRP